MPTEKGSYLPSIRLIVLFITGEETHADKAQISPKYEFSFTQHVLRSFSYLSTVK